ncbi:hypothetical protein MKZ38_004757 [Zalerion maritima]|uniref:Arb2 domain-containing protein n=1 Tax=Zalerion maritima TaxID=339359 RepID=A0AAD5RWD8_9PEZI|nr:hypothetical protein MKZ38_004757 [Zalerion maritima]
MFRRRWSSLPADPIYGDTLEELGYFVNEDDEIRAMENPDTYFKFFISKNTRWNDRQRFHLNCTYNCLKFAVVVLDEADKECLSVAIEKIVHERLAEIGLEKLNLPLGTPSDQPHVPIFVSKNLAEAKRIIVFIQDPCNELGVLAYRIITGAGGINKGSMVMATKYIRETQPDAGIVLANPGELWWWDGGKRALTQAGREAVPRKSAVNWRYDDPFHVGKHVIPGHFIPSEHIAGVFEHVLGNPKLCNPESSVDVIGLGLGGDPASDFFDLNWDSWKDRLKSFFIVGGTPSRDLMQNENYKQWTRDRALAFVLSDEPRGQVISSAEGNNRTSYYTSFGCPVMSIGEPALTELMFIQGYKFVLDKIKEISEADSDPGDPGYKNPDHSDCDYEDAHLREMEEQSEKVKAAWDAADPDKLNWGENDGPSTGDFVSNNPEGVTDGGGKESESKGDVVKGGLSHGAGGGSLLDPHADNDIESNDLPRDGEDS